MIFLVSSVFSSSDSSLACEEFFSRRFSTMDKMGSVVDLVMWSEVWERVSPDLCLGRSLVSTERSLIWVGQVLITRE